MSSMHEKMGRGAASPWEVRDTMIRLGKDAKNLGLFDLAILYNVSALRIGGEILEARTKSKPLPGSARGASDADPV
jgi:hypothetical protein